MKLRILVFLISILVMSCNKQQGDYVCPPCDLDCDKLSFSKPGTCPHCKMKLVLKSELEANNNLTVNDISFTDGAGTFLIEGGFDKEKTILIHYYKSKNFSNTSKVIFVLPGAGRNGKDYRDAWQQASEKYNLLVIAPEYSEKYYPEFWSYNLGGMIADVNIQNETFTINQNPEQWIFEDFDSIFTRIKSELNLITDTYDMFGHSAGGQILHRLAIFKAESKADRMLASNAGWYTVPTVADIFPYGIRNIRASAQRLDFSTNLVLFLGENDNENETRGHLRRSPEVDKQGVHRLERGTYFYNESKKIAADLDADFNWKLEIIPNVGHDYKEMSKRAAEYLYEISHSN